jgi:anti-sigma factor RsiW
MRCDEFLDRYDSLGPGEPMGYLMARHLAACDGCAAQVRAFESLRAELSAGARAEDEAACELVEDRVMAAVRLTPTPQRDFSLRDWIIAGSVIAASMVLVPLGEYFSRFDEAFGASYALPLSLVLGVAITAYASLFVATHMADVQGFMDRHAHARLR